VKPFRTATLSHSGIRAGLYRTLSNTGIYDAWIVDSWDTHFIYCTYTVDSGGIEDKRHLYKQAYKIDKDENVEFIGDPVEVAEAFVKKGTVEVVASRMVAGLAASSMIADLKASNPLFSALDGTPNTHLVVMDLTTIGRASQHQGPVKYLLEKAGLKAAANTIISKPVHVTAKYDGHVDAGAKPVAIGTFLGSVPIDNDDGTITFRTVATLWQADFPDIIEDIQKHSDKLGASYEIAYDPITATKQDDVIRIADYQFSGGAILFQHAAAHPETRMVHASAIDLDELVGDGLAVDERAALSDHEFAYVAGDVRRFPMHTAALRERWGRIFAQVLGEDLTGKAITTKTRNELPNSDFAIPDERRFPIHDEAHRKNAWARVENADLTDAEKAEVRNKIMARAKREKDPWAAAYSKSGGKWVKDKAAAAAAPEALSDHLVVQVFDRITARALAAHDPWVAKVAAFDKKDNLAPPFQKKKDQDKGPDKATKKGGGTMPKYAGIEDPMMEAVVDGLIHNAVVAATTPITAELATKAAELATKSSELVANTTALETAKTEIVTLSTKVNELTVVSDKAAADLTAAKTQLDTLAAEKDAATEKALLDAEWKKIAAMYGLQEKDRAEREPIIRKIIAKKETVSVEEFNTLTKGSRSPIIPLMAGAADVAERQVVPDAEALKKTMPGANLKRRLWN
jgi:hypothetical protein